MTMIISAHLGDCLLIAADKRSMLFDAKTEQMRLFTNEEEKIRLWGLGAVAGYGFKTLTEGQKVSFVVAQDQKGPNATNIVVL